MCIYFIINNVSFYDESSCWTLGEVGLCSQSSSENVSSFGYCLLISCLVRWSVFFMLPKCTVKSLFWNHPFCLLPSSVTLITLMGHSSCAVVSFYFHSLQKPVWWLTVGRLVIISTWLEITLKDEGRIDKGLLDLGMWRKAIQNPLVFLVETKVKV